MINQNYKNAITYFSYLIKKFDSVYNNSNYNTSKITWGKAWKENQNMYYH